MEKRLKKYIDILEQRRALYELRSKTLENTDTKVSASMLFHDLQDEINTIITELREFVKREDSPVLRYKVVFQGDLPRTHKKVLAAHKIGEYDAIKYFGTLEVALTWIEENIDPDCEDDRIVIYEVFSSGHRKPVWHFSGWHWGFSEVDGYDIEQGCLLDHDKCWYGELMEDY